METCLLGIDIGSGGCKVTLLDVERKESVTEASEYPTYTPQAGWAEQDAEEWVRSAGRLIGRVLERACVNASAVTACCIGGVTHSPVLLDENRKVLRRTIHLTDARSVEQAEQLEKRAGELFIRKCLNPVNVMWSASMLLWVRENEPEVWERVSKVLFPKDYVRFRLTGMELTDPIDAQGTLLFNVHEGRWDDELMSLVGIRPRQLPDLAVPTDVVGAVTGEGAEWSGLVVGTPVVAGTTDTLLEVFAAGSKRPGDCTVKLATFGRICVLTDQPVQDRKLITYSYIVPGIWYPGTGTKSFASSLKWFRDRFCRDLTMRDNEKEMGGKGGEMGRKSGEMEDKWKDMGGKGEGIEGRGKENGGKGGEGGAFSDMEEEAVSVQPGCEGLLFHPYLQGEGSPYNDPYLRGSFVGLTLHHTRGHLIRAVMEGTAFSLLDSMNLLRQKGISINGPLRYIGGGTQSRLWTDIVAGVLGIDGVVPRATDPSFGAALLAGVGTGIFGSLEQAQDFCAGHVRVVEHDEERTGIYRRLFEEYRKVHDLLEDVNHRLSRFSAG